MNEFARFSKRAVDYFFDRPARNDDTSPIWCLGRSYDSDYRPEKHDQTTALSTSAKSDSAASHADSAVVTQSEQKPDEQGEAGDDELVKSFDQVQLSKSMDEEDFGWPSEFLEDVESRIWLTYRSDFQPIAKSKDPAAASAMSFTTKLRNIANQGGFTSDSGWGCMIRTGQSLLANTILLHRLGRDWRKGQNEREHRDILSLFADTPEAPFSIHKFVEHGAQACGKYPGEWFGPNATARCIRALTDKYHEAGIRVYARHNDGDVYVDSLIATATQKDADDKFQPTLIVLGIRLGIEKVTPAYHAALMASLELPQSVGIAGGRPSSSHYFLGHQGDNFFYLDPHTTRPMLSPQPSAEDIESCHTRRIRKLSLTEMDPSMLLGFLIRSREDFEDWRKAVSEIPGKAIIHIHQKEGSYATGDERAGAVDEVETLDDTMDDDDADADNDDF
ncbi:cysteine protease atg4 [Lecanosticta acicola]|uniref:Cysteine protease n=1 Tax=Lecanosticta acicola TaxID=111012 RepID=A0AAI9E9Y4_9PEZI|nr:cysteine protease atg4 [Lecanosticta acicola]